jgi:hypothetical protein
MNWLSLASGAVKLVNLIMAALERSRLISQGKKEQVNESLKKWKDSVDKARAARRGVKHDADSVRGDPDSRD